MPLIVYQEKSFRAAALQIIEQANDIIGEYIAAGYQLTLRQLYYQFVSRDLIENTVQSYKRLGNIISDARLAGMIDWEYIEDRTRNLAGINHWESPTSIVQSAAQQFRIDKWSDQNHRIEVWIEKEALSGVIAPICNEMDVSYLSCKGYTSQSEMWAAGQRMEAAYDVGQRPIVLHLGDHDPSGIDMTRDIDDRLKLFSHGCTTVKRIALTMAQVKKYKPPPNPAKTTDSRFFSYISNYGDKSWELDALPPQVLSDLIRKHVLEYRIEDLWQAQVEKESDYRYKLQEAAENYNWEN